MKLEMDAKKKRQLAKRVLFYTLGLVVMAFGIAMSIRAEIGVAPGGAIAVAAYMYVPLTVGQCSALFNAFCVLMQIIITRKATIRHALQLPLAYVFGLILDFFYNMMDFSHPSYIYYLMQLILGMLIFSLGIRAIVGAKLILAPPDGLAMTIGNIFGWPMSKAKLAFDIAATAIAALITLILSATPFLVVGVGTLICAVFTGPLIGLYTKLLPFLDTKS